MGCKSKYATKDFILSESPSPPDYSNLESWAAHPEKNDTIIDLFYNVSKQSLKADVFYIYPTLLTDKKNNSWKFINYFIIAFMTILVIYIGKDIILNLIN